MLYNEFRKLTYKEVRLSRSNDKERYRIQGKIYYKESEEVVKPEDKLIVSEIWNMKNPKGDSFRLLISGGNSKRYSLYECNTDKRIVRTYSISKVVNNVNS